MKSPRNILLWCLAAWTSAADHEKDAEPERAVQKPRIDIDDEENPLDLEIEYSREEPKPFASVINEHEQDLTRNKPAAATQPVLRKPSYEAATENDELGSLQHSHVAGPSEGLPRGSGVLTGNRNDNGQDHAWQKTPKGSKSSRRLNTSRRMRTTRNTKAGDATAQVENIFANDGNRILPNLCVQGTSSFVTNTCQWFDCCDGPNACSWPDDQMATVCPRSCNGDRACEDMAAGTTVGWNSCNGETACKSFAESSTKENSSIGQNSCNDVSACMKICKDSQDCTATIGNNACNGYEDCLFVGSQPSEYLNYNIKSVLMKDGACSSYGGSSQTGGACEILGGYAETIKVGSGSCTAANACTNIGYYTLKDVNIGKDSCIDKRSCFLVGLRAQDGVEIGDGSCLADYSCSRLGQRSLTTVKVGDRSCLDTKSCNNFALYAQKKIEIKDDACTNDQSCHSFAIGIVDKDVKIDDDECTAVQECAGGAFNSDCDNTAKVPNGDDLCPL